MPKASSLEPKQSRWVPTRTQHVYRDNHSGRYYCRSYRDGKEIWRSLRTLSYKVAKRTAPKIIQDIRKARAISGSLLAGKPTVGHAVELYKAQLETNIKIKKASKVYRLETIKTLFRTPILSTELGGDWAYADKR